MYPGRAERGTHNSFFSPKILANLKPRGKNFGCGFLNAFEVADSESEVGLVPKNRVRLRGTLMSLTVLNCTFPMFPNLVDLSRWPR